MSSRRLCLATAVVALAGVAFFATPNPVANADEHKHKSQGPVELTGEVVDLMCYLDHGARGDDHQGCARKCINAGGPVGLLVEQGKHKGVHLVIGDHKPINDKLVKHAAETITLKGKLVSKSGMSMLSDAKIVSQ